MNQQVKIQMFGAFRKFAPSGEFHVEVTPGMTLREFRHRFTESLKTQLSSFQDEELVFDSVFATEDTILNDDEVISKYQTLAVLPPVCGG